MNTLLIGIYLVALAVVSGCASAQVRDVAHDGIGVHPCVQNPLLRSSGLFGGAQPEIFLSGPDLRRGPPPAADSLTRVLNVTEVGDFRDPGAEPVIDKCSSWLQSVSKDEFDLTILWDVRNCPDSFDWDEDDSVDCRSRAKFRFSRKGLGMDEVLGSVEELDTAIERQLVVDAYFTQEIQPTRPHSATGMPLPERGIMHLVVRVTPLGESS